VKLAAAAEAEALLQTRVTALEQAARQRTVVAKLDGVMAQRLQVVGHGPAYAPGVEPADADAAPAAADADAGSEEPAARALFSAGNADAALGRALDKALDKVDKLRARCADREAQVDILTRQLEASEEQRLRLAPARPPAARRERAAIVSDLSKGAPPEPQPAPGAERGDGAGPGESAEGGEGAEGALLASLSDAQLFYHAQLHGSVADLQAEKVSGATRRLARGCAQSALRSRGGGADRRGCWGCWTGNGRERRRR
jgi:hypothetical protein